MHTINISLPLQLKQATEKLIEDGHYVSFSDAVRDALRKNLERIHAHDLVHRAEQDLKQGKSKTLSSSKEIRQFLNSVTE